MGQLNKFGGSSYKNQIRWVSIGYKLISYLRYYEKYTKITHTHTHTINRSITAGKMSWYYNKVHPPKQGCL